MNNMYKLEGYPGGEKITWSLKSLLCYLKYLMFSVI